MEKISSTLAQSKGNVEIEGIEVPNTKIIEMLVNKYKDKLGKDAIDSLFYALYQGTEIYKEENNGKSKN